MGTGWDGVGGREGLRCPGGLSCAVVSGWPGVLRAGLLHGRDVGVVGRVGLRALGEGLEAEQPATGRGQGLGCPRESQPRLRGASVHFRRFPSLGPVTAASIPTAHFIHKTHE